MKQGWLSAAVHVTPSADRLLVDRGLEPVGRR